MWWVLLAFVMATQRRKKRTILFGDSCKGEEIDKVWNKKNFGQGIFFDDNIQNRKRKDTDK